MCEATPIWDAAPPEVLYSAIAQHLCQLSYFSAAFSLRYFASPFPSLAQMMAQFHLCTEIRLAAYYVRMHVWVGIVRSLSRHAHDDRM